MIRLFKISICHNLILNKISYHRKLCPPSFIEVGSAFLVANNVAIKKYMRKYVELLIIEILLKTKMRH